MRTVVGRNLTRQPARNPPNRFAPVIPLPVKHAPRDPRRFPWVPVLAIGGVGVGVLVSLVVCRLIGWF